MKYILLKENIQKARKILKSIDKDESNQHFIRIKEIVGNHTGFLGLFTFLFFKKRVSLIQLTDLLENILQNKKLLKSLPKQVTNYEDIEELEDDLTTAREWAIYNREFVSRLTSKLRKEAKQDVELKNAYTYLEDKNKRDLIENFITKVSRYRDYDTFKTDCIYFMNKNSQVIEDVIQKVNKTKGIYLIYNESNVLIAEVFTREASCSVGSKSWCISGNGGSFWEQYAGLSTGNKQYFIWNFNVSPVSLDSQVGVTINKNGGQKAAHLKDDSSVSIQNYLEKYEIPNILTPLNIEKDIDKIISSFGFTGEVIRLLNDNNLLDNYTDEIPTYYKYVYGLLSDEDTKDLSLFKKYAYSRDRYDEEVDGLFEFCNKFEYEYSNEAEKEAEKFIQENKDNFFIKQINTLDFKDKIILLNKYKDVVTIEDNGILIFFKEEFSLMEGDDHSMDLELGRYSWDSKFDFEFKMDEDYYIDTILDSDEEEYWALQRLNSSYGSILDDIDSDEFNYMSRYFSDEGDSKLKEYLKFIEKYVSHPHILEKLQDIIENITGSEYGYGDYDDKFTDIWDFISDNIDSCFSDPYERYSYFSKFWDEILDSAQDFVNEDANEYTNTLKGEYDENDGVWKINIDDIVDSLRNVDGIFSEDKFTISDWLESHPSTIRNMSTNFYDQPYDSEYLGLADVTSANESLVEQLDDAMNDTHSKFELEDLENMKRYTDYLNKHYEPFMNKGDSWRISDWYGYKKVVGDYLVIIPCKEIDVNGYMRVYSIENSTLKKIIKSDKEKGSYGTLLYRGLNKENEKTLTEKGISFTIISVESLIEEEESIDPNQLKFKFEKLKTFIDFTQTK